MAKLADSERLLWQQTEMLRRLRVHVRELQDVVAVLARRQAGVIIIDLEEAAELPPGATLVRDIRPDGALVYRVEPGGPGHGGPERDR